MFSSHKNSKKRSAEAQGGSKAKKVHLEKSETTARGKRNVRGDEIKKDEVKSDGLGKSKEMKRSRPVTSAFESEDDDDDQDQDEADEHEDVSIEDIDEKTSKPIPNVHGTSSRESHKAQKTLLSQRRSQKPHAFLLAKAKQTWSLLRQKSLSPSQRQEYLQSLTSLLLPEHIDSSNAKTKGTQLKNDIKLKDLILNHSFSRIIQTLLKYSSPSQRDYLAQQLEGSYKELSHSRYSRFLVCKIMKLVNSDRRRKIMGEFQGSVLKMVRHKEAGMVLGEAFELYAGEWERAALVREFFGKEAMMMFGGGFKSRTDEEREKAKKGLRGLLEKLDVEKKKRILGYLKENLLTIFDSPDKDGVTHAILHRALWEYLSSISDKTIILSEEEREKMRREMFESCQEVLAEMVHTKDGSRAVREFLAWGTAKDRKQILKVLKPHIEKMCLDDEAQLVLFTALDVLDDTKLLSKSLIDPIISLAGALYTHVQGRRSLLYLLIPRSRRHFTPVQIACLEETDVIRDREQTSKKGKEVREEEVKRAASGGLVGWVEREGGEAVKEAYGCLIVEEVMLYAEADKKGSIQTLLKALRPSQTKTEEHPDLIIDSPPASRLYKTLLQGGHFNHSTRLIDRVPSETWDTTRFAVRFVSEVGREVTVGMCIGRGNGAFVVAELVEALDRGLVQRGGAGVDGSGEKEGETGEVEQARQKLKEWFGIEKIKEIERGDGKGKKVLLEKLNSL